MERIGVRELRQHASRYLERVRSGETIEITDRGRLVAQLTPPRTSAVERLAAQGRVVEGRGRLSDLEPLPPVTDGATLGETLAAMRDDERY
jgi:prevent-host-death family protein